MAYIPKQVKLAKDRVEAKLDRELIRKLEQFCRYLESDRDYVIGKALEIAFNKDKGFAEWVKTQPAEATQILPGALPEKRPGRRQAPQASNPGPRPFDLNLPRATGAGPEAR